MHRKSTVAALALFGGLAACAGTPFGVDLTLPSAGEPGTFTCWATVAAAPLDEASTKLLVGAAGPATARRFTVDHAAGDLAALDDFRPFGVTFTVEGDVLTVAVPVGPDAPLAPHVARVWSDWRAYREASDARDNAAESRERAAAAARGEAPKPDAPEDPQSVAARAFRASAALSIAVNAPDAELQVTSFESPSFLRAGTGRAAGAWNEGVFEVLVAADAFAPGRPSTVVRIPVSIRPKTPR
ncbi:MAG TPA: hypothetical protein VEI02_10435 [Planctomycetota bacterium]|nr:hypothetical protein [Planctomycetota bacterium]